MSVSGLVCEALEKEEDALDNIPENLQSNERYEKIETEVDLLTDVCECIDEAIEKIEEAMS